MSDSSTTLTRNVDGQLLPAPGSFVADLAHSHVGFSVRHMMIAKVRGRFTELSATLEVAEDPTESRLDVEVQAASIDTRDEQRDGHLGSADFFDVEKFPTLSFHSTGVTLLGGDRLRVDGDLTIRDVTRPLSLDATYQGVAQDPWGNQRLGFDATAEIDREEYGLTWNQALETGGVLVGKQVKLEIEVEFVRQ